MPLSGSAYAAELHLTVVWRSKNKSLSGGRLETSKACTNELHSSTDIHPETKITTQRLGEENISKTTMYCRSSGSSSQISKAKGMTRGWKRTIGKVLEQIQDLSQMLCGIGLGCLVLHWVGLDWVVLDCIGLIFRFAFLCPVTPRIPRQLLIDKSRADSYH